MSTRISVVVITRDRRDQLLDTLQRLVCAHPHVPMIVVDNGSSDGTAARVAHAFPHVELVALRRNAGSAARTVGVRRARTPFVAFADDDSWWADGALLQAERHLDANPDVALVCGRILVGPLEWLDPTCVQMARSPLPYVAGVGPVVLGFVACAAVVRREAYLRAGGFHRRFGVGGEEQLLAIDLAGNGWLCAYADDVVAHHDPDPGVARPGRRGVQTRNDLWTAWLRRRPGVAIGAFAGALRSAAGDDVTRAALLDALRGLWWVLPERRRISAELEHALDQLDRTRTDRT